MKSQMITANTPRGRYLTWKKRPGYTHLVLGKLVHGGAWLSVGWCRGRADAEKRAEKAPAKVYSDGPLVYSEVEIHPIQD